MKKSDISSHVATQASLSKATADRAVDAVFEAIGDALAREESVTIVGFGTFKRPLPNALQLPPDRCD